MKNIAIIPARSGSMGLIDKNIRELDGKPLMAYSILAAKESEMFDTIMVSTDSEKYAQIARKYGAEVPFLRSEKMSSDAASSWDTVEEVLSEYSFRNHFFDSVCLLQPTSPLRTSEDIKEGYALLEKYNADAITSVCEMEHSPMWSMVLDETRSLMDFRRKLVEVPRQKMKTYYRLNGAIYIRKIEYKDKRIVFKYKKEYAYIMKKNISVDIDTIDDFEYAEFLYKKDHR